MYNESVFGNFAGYSNPIVNNAINAMLTSNNVTYIQSLIEQAQGQLYKDAPYTWIGAGMWEPFGGSEVWKTSVISHWYGDPVWSGEDDAPIFNTVTFVNSTA